MAILRDGLNGEFTGTAGTVTGKVVGGQNIVTGPYDKSEKPFTAKQLKQQKSLALVNKFLSPGAEVIKLGFKPKLKKHRPINLAVAYNMKNALNKELPEVEIVYPNIAWSAGDLNNPLNFKAEALQGAALKFSWQVSSLVSQYATPDDQLMVLVFNPAKEEFIIRLNAAARSALSYVLELPAQYSGDQLHCYCFFTGYKGFASQCMYSQLKLF